MVGSTVEVADAAIVPIRSASTASVVPLQSIKKYVIKDKVTTAEVLWSMKLHYVSFLNELLWRHKGNIPNDV